jgi:cytochrome oxidase assembly protein ShyY1
MAAQLQTLPILVVARDDTGDAIRAVPVTAVFRNNHLGYAIQWFGWRRSGRDDSPVSLAYQTAAGMRE